MAGACRCWRYQSLSRSSAISCDVFEESSVVPTKERGRERRECPHRTNEKKIQPLNSPEVRRAFSVVRSTNPGTVQDSAQAKRNASVSRATKRGQEKKASELPFCHEKTDEALTKQPERQKAVKRKSDKSTASLVIPPTDLEIQAARRNQARVERRRRYGQVSMELDTWMADSLQPDGAPPQNLPVWLRPQGKRGENGGGTWEACHYGRRNTLCAATDQASIKGRMDTRVLLKRL